MIAAEPADRRIPTQGIVAAHFDAARAQGIPEAARGSSAAAEPVVDQAYADTLSCLCNQRIREHPAGIVFVDDVAFQVDGAPGAANGIEESRIVVLRILEQPDVVRRDQRCTGSARERLVGKSPHRRPAFGKTG